MSESYDAGTLTATDRETLHALGHALATVGDLAKVLSVRHTAAYQRLDRLVSRGLVTRHEQPGTRAALYEVNDPAGRAAALISSMTPELPGMELRQFAHYVLPEGHQCVACGKEHANCCGLCPHWVPLPV